MRSGLASAHQAVLRTLGVSRCREALLAGRCDPLFVMAACLSDEPAAYEVRANGRVALRWGDSHFAWLVFRGHPDAASSRVSGEPYVKRLSLALDVVPGSGESTTRWHALRAAIVALTCGVPAPCWHDDANGDDVDAVPRPPAAGDGVALYHHLVALANTATSRNLLFGNIVVRTRHGELRISGVVRNDGRRQRMFMRVWAKPLRASPSVWRFACAMVEEARRLDGAQTPIRLAYVPPHGDDEDQISPPSPLALYGAAAALHNDVLRLVYAPPRTVTRKDTLSSHAVRLHRCASDLLLVRARADQ